MTDEQAVKRRGARAKLENHVLGILRQRGDLAVKESELRTLSGMSDNSFREALIRLSRKELVLKWKTEEYVNYVVAAEFGATAYYDAVVKTDDLNALFGTPPSTFNVRRTVPFVLLQDDDLGKKKRNRYGETVA